ncbi:3-phosphoshikimate 1-carboxyvinyltransferase [Peribacillus saganii]|uniref:3-phosphoshikimate 1-carboxyvinyltransferase n=1 Tax=Peribacillus saganii TaxID=2303992 RepID=A0A372LMK0_9BACI|nr:3-phosphoshikimate 1-carboxyvinyltransferase [Peribacillus saganii]RFU68490.1 3-phosphoshikimate 1-carboxyvinyltransferase [Peribacillus saganii]
MDTVSLQTKVKSLRGTIEVPGDKSISHRAVMFGALAEGTTTISHFLPGEDCLSTISCFRQLGVPIERVGDSVKVTGRGFNGLSEPSELLDVGNSGTTIRLMLGILAGQPFHAVLAGDSSIAQRPMTRVVDPLRVMGAEIDGRKKGERTPLSIRGGSLSSINYEMPVASAQVKSAILLAGLQAEGVTTVKEASKTRDHTERMIARFGGEISVNGNEVSVRGKQRFTGTTIKVPGDISSAAFFMVAAAIIPESEVTLVNVGLNPTRTGILDVMLAMGADVTVVPDSSEENAEPAGTIIVRSSQLKGTEIGGGLIPRLIDELPVISLLAAHAEGTTVIKDAQELKVKETNRIDTVAGELSKLGADITPTDDGMIINGGSRLTGGSVSSHGDHRIGMMLAVAGLASAGEVTLENPEAIAVSYPQFFEHLSSLVQG